MTDLSMLFVPRREIKLLSGQTSLMTTRSLAQTVYFAVCVGGFSLLQAASNAVGG